MMPFPFWVVREPGGRIYATLSNKLPKQHVLEFALELSTMLDKQLTLSSEGRKNPTLVHHGLAKSARFHVVTAHGNRPLADFYFTQGSIAERIGQALANALNVQVKVERNIVTGPSSSIHTTLGVLSKRRTNPAQHPGRGETWSQLGGDKVKVMATAPGRIQVRDSEGNRAWVDRGEFLATFRFRGDSPKFNPKRRKLVAHRRPNPKRRKPTIYEALRNRLGREPTNAELKADVARIIREGSAIGRRGNNPRRRANPKGRNYPDTTAWIEALSPAPKPHERRGNKRRRRANPIRKGQRTVATHVRDLRWNAQAYHAGILSHGDFDRLNRATWSAIERRGAAFKARVLKALRTNPRRGNKSRRRTNPRRRKATQRRVNKNPRSDRERAEAMAAKWQDRTHTVTTSRARAPKRVPKVMAKLGELVKVVYRSDKYDGKSKLYEHTTRRPRPVLATADGRDIHIVGGRMHATRDGLVN